MDYRLINRSIGSIYAEDLYNYRIKDKENIFTKFFGWCKTQESNHFLWLALSFFGQIGLTLPLTAFSIVFFGGNNMFLWVLICAVNVPVLVLNLAAFSTKITLPFLFFAWLTQAIVIVYCVAFSLV